MGSNRNSYPCTVIIGFSIRNRKYIKVIRKCARTHWLLLYCTRIYIQTQRAPHPQLVPGGIRMSTSHYLLTASFGRVIIAATKGVAALRIVRRRNIKRRVHFEEALRLECDPKMLHGHTALRTRVSRNALCRQNGRNATHTGQSSGRGM